MDEETKKDKPETDKKERFTMVDQIAVAVSAPGSYNKLTDLRLGRNIVYFIILIFLLAFMRMGISTIVYISNIGGFKNLILNTMPEFSVEDGTLTMADKMELNIGEDVILYVDTSVEKISLDNLSDSEKVCIAFGHKNVMIALKSSTYSQEYLNVAISDMFYDGLNNQTLSEIVPVIYITIGLMFFCTMVGQMVSILFLALILFIVARVMAGKFENKLSSGKIYLICMYSLSLPMLLMRANEAAGFLLPSSFAYIIGICIALSFVGRGIMSHANIHFDNKMF